MADIMEFPASVEEFMEQYKMTDTKHVYSNGTEYVPIYRMMQWFDHVNPYDFQPVRHGRWVETRVIRYNGDKPYTQFAHNCSCCNYLNKKKKGWRTKFCPNCGAKMDESQ